MKYGIDKSNWWMLFFAGIGLISWIFFAAIADFTDESTGIVVDGNSTHIFIDQVSGSYNIPQSLPNNYSYISKDSVTGYLIVETTALYNISSLQNNSTIITEDDLENTIVFKHNFLGKLSMDMVKLLIFPGLILGVIAFRRMFFQFKTAFSISESSSSNDKDQVGLSNIFSSKDEYLNYIKAVNNQIYSSKEKWFVVIGTMLIGGSMKVGEYFMGSLGTMYGVYTPLTEIAYWTNTVFWSLVLLPLGLSLLWFVLGILKGIALLDKKQDYLKNISREGLSSNTVSFATFKGALKPLSTMIFIASLTIIAIAILFATAGIVTMFVSNTILFGNIITTIILFFVAIGIFIYPQLGLRRMLIGAKNKLILTDEQLYEERLADFTHTLSTQNPIKHNKIQDDLMTDKEIQKRNEIRVDLSTLKEILQDEKAIDTWPYGFQEMKRLGALISGPLIAILLLLISNYI